MNAREYLESVHPEESGYISKEKIAGLMEDYHQQDSEDRYTKAIESVMGLIVAKPHLKDAFEECARVASGKEEG